MGEWKLLVLTVALSAAAVPASAASGGKSVFGAVTSRVTVNTAGQESSSVFVSTGPAVSRDGRFVAFSAGARDLAPGGDPRFGGIYVRDRLAGRTFVASVADNGAFPSTAATVNPAISANGRYVAFDSYAPNLVPRDTNHAPDVFVRDTVGGHTERVSVTSAGRQVDGYSQRPSLSADGRYVVFESAAAIASDDRNGNFDVYVHDRVAGTTMLVSRNTAGSAGDSRSDYGAISGDGRWAAFSSYATNLGGSGAGVPNVYLRDLLTGRTLAVTTFDRAGGENSVLSPTVSYDGRYVAYSTNVTPAGRQPAPDQIYRWDRVTGRVVLVSQTPAHERANGFSSRPSISYDGNRIAFTSNASDLVAARPSTNEIYVRDVTAGSTEIASVTPDGSPANSGNDANIQGSVDPAISGNGRHVVFLSGATNLFEKPERYSGPEVFARDPAVGG